MDRCNLRHRQLRQKRVVISDDFQSVRDADAQLHCCLNRLRRNHVAAAEQAVNPLILLHKFKNIGIVPGIDCPFRRKIQLDRLDFLLPAGFQEPFFPGICRHTDPGRATQAANPPAALCNQLLRSHPAALVVVAEDTGIA